MVRFNHWIAGSCKYEKTTGVSAMCNWSWSYSFNLRFPKRALLASILYSILTLLVKILAARQFRYLILHVNDWRKDRGIVMWKYQYYRLFVRNDGWCKKREWRRMKNLSTKKELLREAKKELCVTTGRPKSWRLNLCHLPTEKSVKNVKKPRPR